MTIYTRALASWRSWRAERALATSTKRFRKALPEIDRLSAREARQRARHGRVEDLYTSAKAITTERLMAETGRAL